jgi:hypothetical protein
VGRFAAQHANLTLIGHPSRMLCWIYTPIPLSIPPKASQKVSLIMSGIFDNEGNHPQRVEIHVGTGQLSIDSNKSLKCPSYKEKQIHFRGVILSGSEESRSPTRAILRCRSERHLGLIADDLSIYQLPHLPSKPLYKPPVMRNRDHRSWKCHNSCFKRLQHIKADIVGWFIEQKHVWAFSY